MRNRVLLFALALLLVAPVAFAKDKPGGPPGQAKKDPPPPATTTTSQPAAQPAAQPTSTNPASPTTSGTNETGVKPSNSTQKGTYATAGSGATKQYGNGKTAGRIATDAGLPASTVLYGPGNSQPHKVQVCPGGPTVDVHAIKAHLKKCPAASVASVPTPAAAAAPATTQVNEPVSITVQAAPGTVVTAEGAGVDASVVASPAGVATVRVVPRRAGVLAVRAGSKPIKKYGVLGAVQSGSQLTG